MLKQANRYTIIANVAREKGIPACFVAAELVETQRGAVYLYGHGEMDPMGRCCQCGKTLTHPGSILIGIGPECLGNWGLRDAIKDNMTEQDVARLRSFVRERQVDCWLPKSVIKSVDSVDEKVDVPDDHKMLKKEDNQEQKKTATLDGSGNFAIIKFGYDPKLVDNVRRLEGRRWNSEKKYWSAWASKENLENLLSWGFELSEDLMKIARPPKMQDVKVTKEDIDLPGLYPFQVDGVKFIEARRGKALIADEMGLGKTIQAIGWMKLHPEIRPVIIVVPASLKLNWERELWKWLGDCGCAILNGKNPSKKDVGQINIINYDILAVWLPLLIESNPQLLIVDESHYIKNNDAQRTKAVRELSKHCKNLVFLTGTPITNRPEEFFTTLNILEPREFSSWFRYVTRYCGAVRGPFGWETGGATNTEELHNRLTSTLMVRRKKEDVLMDLPTKRRLVVPVEINNRAKYEEAEENLLGWLRENFGVEKAEKASQAEALARFNYLKQLAAEGALEMQVQWIKDSLDSNGKLVIFAVHHSTIDRLSEELRNYNPVVVDGRVSIENRQKAVDRFQTDPECRIFIGNIRAAGVGLTLTASSNTVFCELGWTPGEHDQAEDRVHRIGQTESVCAWYLMAAGTIMEEIAGILDEKRLVLDAVLDGKETPEESMLKILLRNRMRS